jgi:beta-glucosidase
LSIEWSRVQPAPDIWDESAIEHYRDMVRGLVERDMTPMVTLHHFSDPLWLVEKGGWESEAVVGYFEKYVRKIVEALQEYVSLWVTINEPNVYVIGGYFLGVFPPGKNNFGDAIRVVSNQIGAHARAYHAIHQLQPTARVGIAQYYRSFVPRRSWFPLDAWMASIQANLLNNMHPHALQTGVLRILTRVKRIPEAKGTQDYFGLNYYSRDYVRFNPFKPGELFAERTYREDAELSSTEFIANEPEGFFEALKWARQFNIPIIVTENGVEDSEDRLRPRYLVEHLHQLWRAVNFNYPVKGYFHWTLVDNFEWERGWTQRFGLWELDVDTGVRRKRDSADLYAEICKENGISSEMVARYTPELFPMLFPN